MTSGATPIRVLLVDDHAVVREGYRRLIEREPKLEFAGEAASAAQAYQLYCAVSPDVVVMDISLPDVSGIEAMRRILARDARARVLVFSMHEEGVFVTRALQAGARGYITKASAPEVLVEAIRAVAAGKTFLSNDVAQTLALDSIEGAARSIETLSEREFEIARLLASGHTVAGIAQRLGLGAKTVANYQSSIRQKLGIETSAQLTLFAARSGLLDERMGA
jgi:DNA-binding NarL/FixJ family response regulator